MTKKCLMRMQGGARALIFNLNLLMSKKITKSGITSFLKVNRLNV